MSRQIAIDLDAVRRPVRDDLPAGPDLTFDSKDRVYQQIRNARPAERGAEAPDQLGHLFERQAVTADWPKIAKLGLDALYDRTKDLQIAAWVAEALAHTSGLAGLADGFALIRALQETFWDEAHPTIEDGDVEFRATPYTFLVDVLPGLIRGEIALTGGTDRGPEATLEWYDRAKFAGTLDAWTVAASRADRDHVERAEAELADSLAAFEAWKADTGARFGFGGPDLGRIGEALKGFEAAFRAVVRALPPSSRPAAAPPDPASTPAAPEPAPASSAPTASPPTAPSPTSVADPVALAESLARAGRLAEALGLLDGARHTTRSRRERFLLQLRLAELCADGGRSNLALQLLEELEAQVDDRRLEEWEDPEVCARVLDALIRALKALDSDDADRLQKYYTRLCRLDPRRALNVDPGPRQ
jgi:type VI secretion system protein ImpA